MSDDDKRRFDVTQRYGACMYGSQDSPRSGILGRAARKKYIINKGGDYGGRDTDCETEIAIERSR